MSSNLQQLTQLLKKTSKKKTAAGVDYFTHCSTVMSHFTKSAAKLTHGAKLAAPTCLAIDSVAKVYRPQSAIEYGVKVFNLKNKIFFDILFFDDLIFSLTHKIVAKFRQS